MAGKSDRKLLSRICFGSSGRKGRKSDAPAMLNMLPKFALVVMKTYLSVLAKVRRPSRTPSISTSRSLLQQHDVGRLLGHVHGAVDGDADVRRVQGRGVVDAVAHVADHVPALAQRQDDALLLVRLDLGEDVRPLGPLAESVGRSSRAARRRSRVTGAASPTCRASCAATSRLSPVIILKPMPAAARSARVALDPRLGRVGEGEEAEEGHPRFVVLAADAGARRRERARPPRPACESPRCRQLGEPRPRLASRTLVERRLSRRGLRPRADREHLGERALGHQPPLAAALDQHAQPLADEVVGHLVELAPVRRGPGPGGRGSPRRSGW